MRKACTVFLQLRNMQLLNMLNVYKHMQTVQQKKIDMCHTITAMCKIYF